jgi:hypothetical protein
MSAPNLGRVPRKSDVLDGAKISRDYDVFLNDMLTTLQMFADSILSGPDADPNGIVIGRPGYLYRAMGDDSVTASALYVKESGVDTDTGWVLK